MDNYLLNLSMYPDACIRLSEALCAFYLSKLEKWLKAVGPHIDIILFGDDLGGQNGPLISPQMYQEYFKPYHKKMWSAVKKWAPLVAIHLHSCGGIEPLLNDLIEAGLEIANPVQITCKGMDPRELKQKYGDRLVFWGGGCDTRHILPHGTPDEVRKHVKEQVSILSPSGGFVFQQVHNILADVPPENIIAMYEAIRE
jgi:uroporphyrinogen decarboxylase